MKVKVTAPVRWIWLVLFVAQIVLYYQAYPHLVGVAPHSAREYIQIGGNIIALDILGGGSWCTIIIFGEELTKERVKGLRWLIWALIGLFFIFTVGVAFVNVRAWIA